MLSPCLFNLYTKCIMQNTGLNGSRTGIKITRRKINNLRYRDDTAPMVESELKSLLVRVKEERKMLAWNSTLKKKTKVMSSGPITSWQIEGKSGSSDRFYFLGFKKHCNHEIKSHCRLGGKAMTNLDSVLKIGGKILPTNICIVEAMVFPIVTYGCDSWI